MKIIKTASFNKISDGWSFHDVQPLDPEKYPPGETMHPPCDGPTRMRNGQVVYYCDGEYYQANGNGGISDIAMSPEEAADLDDAAKHSTLPGKSFEIDAQKARSVVGPMWGILQREGTVKSNFNSMPCVVTKSQKQPGMYTVSVQPNAV